MAISCATIVQEKMIKDIKIESNKVLWTFENRTITLELEDVFWASERKETHFIEIETGKNFKQKKVYFFNYAGEQILYYDLDAGTVEWSLQENRKKITVENMNQVGFFPQEKRIFIISSCGNQELLGYDTNGNYLFKVKNPSGFKMLYFSILRHDIIVVCDGEENQEDKYGRFRYNFFIDINTGKLTKGGVAY